MRRFAIPPVVLAFAALHAQPAAGVPVATRVIDRTLICNVAERAGVNVLELSAQSGGFRQQDQTTGKRSIAPSSLWMWTGFGFGEEQSEVVTSSAGKGDAGHVAIGETCSPAGRRMPLSSRRLAGGVASRLATSYECFTPPRVLVRVRTVFAAPKSLRPHPLSKAMIATGTVRESAVAMRTLKGKPILFASMRQSGKMRLFLERGCFEDDN